jgi:hypothetical protein
MSNRCLTCVHCDIPVGAGADQGICHFDPPSTNLMMTPNGPVPMVTQHLVNLGKDYCSHYAVQLVKAYSGNVM